MFYIKCQYNNDNGLSNEVVGAFQVELRHAEIINKSKELLAWRFKGIYSLQPNAVSCWERVGGWSLAKSFSHCHFLYMFSELWNRHCSGNVMRGAIQQANFIRGKDVNKV